MASCKLGHVYIVRTALAKPPKPKFAVCVSIEEGSFLWINSNAKPHGRDQMALPALCHELVVHDSFLDLSRVVQHPTHELEDATEFSRISSNLAKEILECIDAGLYLMPANHTAIVRDGILKLL